MELNYKTVILCIIFGCGATFFLKQMVNTHKDMQEEIERGGPEWNQEEAQKLCDKSANYIAQAEKALNAGKYSEAISHEQRADYAVKNWIDRFPEKELPDGTKLKEWYNNQQETYGKKLRSEFARMLAQLETPEGSVSIVRTMVQYHRPLGLDEEFAKSKERLIPLRTQMAWNWLRVEITSCSSSYSQILKDYLRKQNHKLCGRTMVFGSSLSPQETNRTWLTLKVVINEESESFSNKQVDYISIPHRLKVEFRLETKRKVLTNWGHLAKLQVTNKLPTSIGYYKDELSTVAQAEQLKWKEKLEDEFKSALRKLPVFEVGRRDNADLHIMSNGKVEISNAITLGLINFEKFKKELKKICDTQVKANGPALLETLLEFDKPETVAMISSILQTSDKRQHYPLATLMKKRPWIGDYKPLISFINSMNDPYQKQKFILALEGQLHVEKVRNLVLKEIESLKPRNRLRLAQFFLQGIPVALLPQYMKWLKEQPETVVHGLISPFHRRVPEKLNAYTITNYDSFSLKLKERFMTSFQPKRGKNDFSPEAIALFKKAAADKKSERLKSQGLKLLLSTVYHSPAGWQALKEVSGELKGGDRERAIRELVMSAKKVVPKQALAFMTRALDDESESVIKEAIHWAVHLKDEKGDFLDKVWKVVRQKMENERFLESVMHSLQNGASASGFAKNLSNTSLIELGMFGCSHSNKKVRFFAANFASTMLSKYKNKCFRKMLEAAMSAETEINRKKQLQKRLN